MDDTLLKYFNLLITLLKRKTGVHFIGFLKTVLRFKIMPLKGCLFNSSISKAQIQEEQYIHKTIQ